MFKIAPIQDKTRQKEICESLGTEFRPEAFGYIMFDIDTEALMGFSQFEIGEVGYIYDLLPAKNTDDFEAMFILGRQTMNVIESWGIADCYAEEDAADPKLLHAIGFRESEGGLHCRLVGMFDGNCKNH